MAHELLTAIPLSIMAAAIFALFARWAHQPLIIGYIAGGVADHVLAVFETAEEEIVAGAVEEAARRVLELVQRR